MMQKIVTLTLNPAIDKSTTVPAILPDKKLRCTQPKFEPGGGGVNVSRALQKLGGHSTAVYLAGSYSGKHFQQLLQIENIDSCIIDIEGHTRENLIVMDSGANLQYRFGMPGPLVQEHEWKKTLDVLLESDGIEYVIASGSLPDGVPLDYYGRLAFIAKKKGFRLIVDTSREPLKQAANEGVFMIKPNLGELSNLLGVEELHEEDALNAAKEIINEGGSEVVVISMGASGAMLVTKDAHFRSSSPAVKRRSTVGAGDSMVAGMVMAMSSGYNWMEVLQFGVATGTATTMNPGTELCKKEDVMRLYELIKKR